jgi:hypothetical protein
MHFGKMAKVKQQEGDFVTKTKRSGVFAKTKTSNLKTSKNYVKSYRGQGR